MPSSTAGLCLRAVVVGVVLLGAWQMQQQLQLSQLKQRLLQPHPPPPQHQQRPAADVLAPGPDESFVLNVDQLPRGLPGGDDDYIFLTFASAAVDELLTNWVLHMQRLRLPALVAAMDSFVLDRCAQLRVHALDTSEGRRAESAGADNIRGNPGAFLTIGARKVGAIRAVLQRSGRAVLVSDVDVVWMGDPRPLLSGELAGYEDLRHADVLASSDCLDPALVCRGPETNARPSSRFGPHPYRLTRFFRAAFTQDLKDNGCFHILLDRNTGVVLVRNTTNGAAAMQEWQARTAGAFQAWETDQTAFDDMLRGRGRGHRRAMTPAQRTEWHAGKLSWCSEGTPPSSPRYRPGVAEGATMGEPSELGGNHTPGSRRLFEVCVPQVATQRQKGRPPYGRDGRLDWRHGSESPRRASPTPPRRRAPWSQASPPNGSPCSRPDRRHVMQVARRLLFGLLPLPLIANGHSFFVQQLQRQTGVWPLAVHATYQFEDQQDCAFGKRERFREWGLWALRGTPAEDDAPDENFLVLHAEPPREAAVPWVGQADPHARGRQHVTHLDRFRRRLALGVSLARMLNRTVVLPRFWCDSSMRSKWPS